MHSVRFSQRRIVMVLLVWTWRIGYGPVKVGLSLSDRDNTDFFPIDQEVTPSATSQSVHVAGQEAAGLYCLGRCPLPTKVAQHKPEEIFLEHPMFDKQGRLLFHYKTLFDYQQEDPQLLELPTSTPQQYQWKTWVDTCWCVAITINITVFALPTKCCR